MSDMEIAREKGLILHKPCFASIGHFIQKPELTSILKELIKVSSTPLKTVEKDFAIDSSGFSTSRFARWFSTKHGKDTKKRIWITCHLMAGTKTNIVTACEVTKDYSHDSKEFPKLMKTTNENFEIKQISADKAYSGRPMFNIAEEIGAEPFIPFKKNAISNSRGCGLWTKMYHYFIYKHDEFLQAYHKRSNVETVFHMIKTKFKDNLRSKSKPAQINELLCKVLCHNICVIIQEMNELGIRGEFVVENKE